MSLSYRKDIDGLRAVAVLSVVVYHLGLPLEFDGFVGVDIFFVISGYLISGILYREISSGSFSLIAFYIRRIKRILPALYVVVAVTTIIGVGIMLPNDIKDLGKSAFSATLSASNVNFWYSADTSYFARSSELEPLLHTWSLGVEEQFYIVWPLLMFLIYRLAKGAGVLFMSIIISIGSYAYAEYLLAHDPSYSYYMIPCRAGELLTGTIAFFGSNRPIGSSLNPKFIEACAVLGFALMAYGLFIADSAGQFPGLNSIAPCAGTALLLVAGSYRRTLVARFLSLPPMVAVGLISYSLYLWHWPVVSFARYLYTALSPAVIFTCIVVMLVLSTASYRFVEVPMRRRTVSRRTVFAWYLTAPAALIVPCALYLYWTQGLSGYIEQGEPYRAALSVRERYARPAFEYAFVCQTDNHSDTMFNDSQCLIGDAEAAPRMVLWGDSHAAHHAGFFAEIGERQGFSMRNFEVGNCPPVFGTSVEYVTTQSREPCRKFRSRMETVINDYDDVVLGAAWAGYIEFENFYTDLRATIEALVASNKRVILLGQIPTFTNFSRDCALRNARMLNVDCIPHAARRVITHPETNQLLAAIADAYPQVAYFDVADLVCDPTCSPYRETRPIYYDSEHLSISGSQFIGRQYEKRTSGFFPTDVFAHPGTNTLARH